MNEGRSTRREFLRVASLGMAAIVMPSSVSTPRKASEKQTFTFAQICDPQLGMGGFEHDVKALRAAAAQISALKPDFVVICGDLVNTANDKAFADFNKIKAELKVPCHCVPGNHDVGNEPTPESLRYYRQLVGEDYFSFEHKGYLLVFVNTQLWKAPVEGESKLHDSWLVETLEAAARKRTPVFVIGHYPLFLKSLDEAEEYMNLPLAKRTELLRLFKKRGVVAVLGGHTHRLLINEYKGIQLVNAETTSNNFDQRPFGFRLWHVEDERPFQHEFVPLVSF